MNDFGRRGLYFEFPLAHPPFVLFFVQIQYGSPDTVEAYTHRLGRTARIGSKGRGLLVLLPFDRGFLKKAQRRDIEEDIELTDKISELTSNNDVKSILHPALELIRNGDKVLYPAAEMAYLSILAHFMARTESRGLGKKHVLDLSNQFAKAAGLTEPPPLSDELISKLKLETIISKDK